MSLLNSFQSSEVDGKWITCQMLLAWSNHILASRWPPNQFSLLFFFLVGCQNGKLLAIPLPGGLENGNVSFED